MDKHLTVLTWLTRILSALVPSPIQLLKIVSYNSHNQNKSMYCKGMETGHNIYSRYVNSQDRWVCPSTLASCTYPWNTNKIKYNAINIRHEHWITRIKYPLNYPRYLFIVCIFYFLFLKTVGTLISYFYLRPLAVRHLLHRYLSIAKLQLL